MQQRTKPSAKIAVSLYYNEKKVKIGTAECIYAGNFLKDAADLTRADKRERFRNLLECNQRVVNTGMHILLGVASKDKFDNQRLSAIAVSYMRRIGYGEQPYLVYHHRDTAAQHLHIVTTTIRSNGSQIGYSFIGPRLAEPALKAVELEFGLAGSLDTRLKQSGGEPPQKIRYGELPSSQAITLVLQYVLHAFRYRSISELNAILGLYNLTTISGLPGSRLHQYGGLLYHITNENGKGMGTPIKASKISFKPTLKWLGARFEQNRQPDPATITQTRVEFASIMRKTYPDNPAFQDALRRGQLALAPDRSVEGRVIGLLLVNLAAKAVVNLAELGLELDPKSIRQKLGFDPLDRALTPDHRRQTQKQQHKKGLRL